MKRVSIYNRRLSRGKGEYLGGSLLDIGSSVLQFIFCFFFVWDFSVWCAENSNEESEKAHFVLGYAGHDMRWQCDAAPMGMDFSFSFSG